MEIFASESLGLYEWQSLVLGNTHELHVLCTAALSETSESPCPISLVWSVPDQACMPHLFTR